MAEGCRCGAVQVVRGWVGGGAIRSLPDVPTDALLAGTPHAPLQAALADIAPAARRMLCDAVVLNSTATLDAAADGGDIVDNGNRTETALLRFAAGLGAGAAAGRAGVDVVAALPFSSERKRMATVVRRAPRGGAAGAGDSDGGGLVDGGLTVYVKGAAEVWPDPMLRRFAVFACSSIWPADYVSRQA